jgi:hypothetical protein
MLFVCLFEIQYFHSIVISIMCFVQFDNGAKAAAPTKTSIKVAATTNGNGAGKSSDEQDDDDDGLNIDDI